MLNAAEQEHLVWIVMLLQTSACCEDRRGAPDTIPDTMSVRRSLAFVVISHSLPTASVFCSELLHVNQIAVDIESTHLNLSVHITRSDGKEVAHVSEAFRRLHSVEYPSIPRELWRSEPCALQLQFPPRIETSQAPFIRISESLSANMTPALTVTS